MFALASASARSTAVMYSSGRRPSCANTCVSASRNRAKPSSRQAHVQAMFGGGGGGNPFDMKNLMENVKKAQQRVQEETSKVQRELANTEYEGFDEDETVRVVMSGNQEPRGVDVTEAALEGGVEMLSQRLTVAMKDAHQKSAAGMKERMKILAKDLGVPNAAALGM